MDIKVQLRDYIMTEILRGKIPEGFDDDYDLLGNRALDSLGIMELVFWLENVYGINVGIDDVTPENFGTLNALSQYVQNKKPSQQRQT